MQNAGDQKLEMEELKKSAAEENKVLEKRKKAIDAEMAEVCFIICLLSIVSFTWTKFVFLCYIPFLYILMLDIYFLFSLDCTY